MHNSALVALCFVQGYSCKNSAAVYLMLTV